MTQNQSKRDRELGIGPNITRKDFVNATVLGVGSVLLHSAAPAEAMAALSRRGREGDRSPVGRQEVDPWTGYGGVGDYARSNGNTRPVMEAAHKIRDGTYTRLPADLVDTGEVFDLVVVGGGLSGLSAAYYFRKATGGRMTCLILENHPIFGGEAKGNEFNVNGVRLIGPQGSNGFGAPREGSGTLADELFTDLNIPREFSFQEWDPSLKPIRFPLDNYAHMDGIVESKVDVGYLFDQQAGSDRPKWVGNIWYHDLENAPFSAEVKRDLLKWRYTGGEDTEEFRRFIDTMTYKDYIEKVMGLRPEVTKLIEPIVGLINGVSPDAVSAKASNQIGMPGVGRVRGRDTRLSVSGPDGNGQYGRYFIKALIPDAIQGAATFDGVLNGRVNFSALDQPGNATRMRVGATVVRVEHSGPGSSATHVSVVYEQGGKAYRVKARTVVMASGGWVNKHVIVDLPTEIKEAYGEFHHAPALVVNVALTNWRFLYKLGFAACRWFGDGFGFSCNIRRSMVAGDYRPQLHPDKPTILTFYMGLYTPGRSAYEQVVLGRERLMSTMFADYERQCREQMIKLFGDSGFDPSRDIAGIILNRWGHARLVQPPGWYYGRNGEPPAREVVEKGFGRVAIGHSELNGHQSVTGAMRQGQRAVEQVLKLL